jgi:flavorubredoxin
MKTRIDCITGGIYRISAMSPEAGITFNQFLIDDERPTLIHTGVDAAFESVRAAIAKVMDPKRLAFVALLHWEGDENGGMSRFMADAPGCELIGSDLSIRLNASGFGITQRVRGFTDGERLVLGRHVLRFLETPHVHHWDSMMVLEETTNSLFPADLFLQPGDQPPVVTENLSREMIETYRAVGIFASEHPVRQVVDRIAGLDPSWVHAMHGGTLARSAIAPYVRALREQEFAFRGTLLGRQLPAYSGQDAGRKEGREAG